MLNRTENKNKKHKLSFILLIIYQQYRFKHVKRAHQRKVKIGEWNYFTVFYINKHYENNKA